MTGEPNFQILIIFPIAIVMFLAWHLYTDWFHWNKGMCRDYNEPWRLERITAGSDVIFKCRGCNLRISWMMRKILLKDHQVEYGVLYWKSKHTRNDIEHHIKSLTSL